MFLEKVGKYNLNAGAITFLHARERKASGIFQFRLFHLDRNLKLNFSALSDKCGSGGALLKRLHNEHNEMTAIMPVIIRYPPTHLNITSQVIMEMVDIL